MSSFALPAIMEHSPVLVRLATLLIKTDSPAMVSISDRDNYDGHTLISLIMLRDLETILCRY